jgi:hypothetical protein
VNSHVDDNGIEGDIANLVVGENLKVSIMEDVEDIDQFDYTKVNLIVEADVCVEEVDATIEVEVEAEEAKHTRTKKIKKLF